MDVAAAAGEPESPKDLNRFEQKTRSITNQCCVGAGGADHFKSEPKYIFVSGVFGCIFPWGEE